MSTILTDDERPKLPMPRIVRGTNPHCYSDLDMEAYADAREAAVLAKLAQQEPVAWHTEDHLTDRSATTYSKEAAQRWQKKGWPVTPLYAAPQPAVVQVPQDFDYKHPRAQALIGADARHRIVIDLVVNWRWAQPGEFENPGVYYWDGAKNVLCVPHLAAAPEAPAQADQHCRWCAACGEGVTNFCRGKTADCPMFPKAHPIPPQWREAMKVAREALMEAEEAVIEWGCYAAAYYQEKHDLEGDIKRIRAALAQLDALGGGMSLKEGGHADKA